MSDKNRGGKSITVSSDAHYILKRAAVELGVSLGSVTDDIFLGAASRRNQIFEVVDSIKDESKK